MKDDPVDELFFLTSGRVGFVLEKYDDVVYLIVEAGYYFGELDFVIGDNEDMERKFTTKAIVDSEMLIITRVNLMKVDQEFGE